MNKYIATVLLVFATLLAIAQDTINITDIDKEYFIGRNVAILEDKAGVFSIDDVQKKEFTPSASDVPNLQITPSAYWVKFTTKNSTNKREFVISVAHPTIDKIILYSADSTGHFSATELGEDRPFGERFYNHQSYIFNITLRHNTTSTFYIRVNASEQLQLPISIGRPKAILEGLMAKDLFFGLYCGIIIVMTIYNLFIYLTVRDKSYLFYVAYIICVGLTQVTLQGYGFRFLWSNSSWMANQAPVLIPFLNGITALEFIRRFLNVHTIPRLNKGINIFEFIYVICFVLGMMQLLIPAQLAIQGTAFFASLYVFYLAVKFSQKGQRAAKFFLFAWSIFLASVCVFVLRNFDLIPYNNYTHYVLEIGSALEVTLLSFALADKINLYRKEKEESQAEALRISLENEKIIREQNIVLEQKVEERTHDLNEANKDLSQALDDLKHAQTKLVDAEKMASLGQLTAGIAHEINNPINFVSSNINPLRRDIEDILHIIQEYDQLVKQKGYDESFTSIDKLKHQLDFGYLQQEIDMLLKGMADGATRTVEIVKGLKSFSRLDESDLKFANINDGIESTLVILNNNLKDKIDVEKDLGEIPEVECYAGKLNQVFMNIISNAAQAINGSKKAGRGIIKIATELKGKDVVIRIKDNGEGMSKEVRQKIFEPFFTTKRAGEGTGLGLSIVFSIIELHNGDIKVESELGIGTEFIITLPIVQPK